MTLSEFLINICYALISTAGFSLLFRLDIKRLPLATLGGGIEWATYLIVFNHGEDVFVATMVATIVATFFSELCAHLCRTPATVFLMPALIPLVPGGSLYYTMSHLIAAEYTEAWRYGRDTIYVILGIAGGVVVASLVVYALRGARKK